MRTTTQRQRVTPLALATLLLCQCLMSSCAHRIKVREKWRTAQSSPIDYRAAAETWKRIKKGSTTSETELAAYNLAVRQTVSQLSHNWSHKKNSLAEIPTREGRVKIRVDLSDVDNAGLINHLVPADFVKIGKGLHARSTVEGIGSPMVARRKWSDSDPMVPKEGLWFPLTAYLNFDTANRPVLTMRDPTRRKGLLFPGRSTPLAANYSAFIAQDFSTRQWQIVDVPAMFRFEWFESQMGLYRISEFDRNKEPCILVHGVNSSPLTWNNTVNELLANKEIREKYEFWTFGYPTGAPIPYLAMKMRDAVEEMHSFREHSGAVSPKLTVVAHSMGGLLAKTLTLRSGDENWNQVFNVPPEELKMSEESRELLRRIMYFEPHGHIDKMIFISTPHKGSNAVRSAPAKIVSSLIQIPKQLLEVSTEILTLNPSALTPLGMDFVTESPTSLEQMRSNSRIIELFSNIQLNPEVRYFSIIGNNSRLKVPLEKTSDSVVTYLSSHLEGAESEKVIRSRHAVHKTPEGVAEIIRILNLD